MRDIFNFKDVEASEKASIRRSLRQKLRRFEKLLRSYDEDAAQLRVTVRGPSPVHKRWEVRGILRLSTGTLVSEADSSRGIEPALDEVAEELLAGLRRHRQLLRKEFLSTRKNRRRDDLAAVEPLLARDAARNRREEFFILLRPELEYLVRVARREIRLRERAGKLPKNLISPTDLVDEAVLRAWSNFSRRPDDISVDAWLTRILHNVLDDTVTAAATESAVSPRPEIGAGSYVPDMESDRWWWFQLQDEDDPIIWEDFLPDQRVLEPLESLSATEERERILHALAQLPIRDRAAFTLSELDGYDIEEVARIQERSPEEVKRSIENVRSHLRKTLAGGGGSEVD